MTFIDKRACDMIKYKKVFERRFMQMKKRSSALSAERIRAYLPENAPRIFVYDEISSTNDAAKEYAESGGSFAVFIADRQTKGRGRLAEALLPRRGQAST